MDRRYTTIGSLLLLLPFLWLSCGGNGNDSDLSEAEGYTKLPEDFKTFYKKFHTDSMYQMEHIRWPLQGLPPKADSATVARDTFLWIKDRWRMHRPFRGENSAFNRYFEAMGPKLIIETFLSKRGNFGIVRRWAKLENDEWYLIYYVGNNKLTKVH